MAVQRRFNAASVLAGGRVVGTYCKRELPNYQVFDERRYFASGRDAGLPPLVFEAGGLRFGVLICEDAWFDEPAQAAREAGAQVLCVLNASPFHLDKAGEREAAHGRARARHAGCRCSTRTWWAGRTRWCSTAPRSRSTRRAASRARAPAFEERPADARARPPTARRAAPWRRCRDSRRRPGRRWSPACATTSARTAFPGAIIGLSGGIDSALVLAIAVDALGADRVRTVMMPSPYTADISWIDARDMAARLGVRYDEIAIAPMFDAFRASLAPQFAGLAEDTTEENLQARIRGTLLMALSNKTGRHRADHRQQERDGHRLLHAVRRHGGRLCRHQGRGQDAGLPAGDVEEPPADAAADGSVGPVIPERIITRPPSAELRPDQTDQDSLPPYEVLDAILARYMEEDQGIDEIVAAGFARADVERVTRLIKLNEYKRRQAPVGIRITHRAFGRDWRYPITSKFRA